MTTQQRFAFVSRHAPTTVQLAIAAGHGIELVPVEDIDAFHGDFTTIRPRWNGPSSWTDGDEVHERYKQWFRDEYYHGIVVVHPAAALRCIGSWGAVGVFENAADRGSGSFAPIALHVWVDKTHTDGASHAIIEHQ